MTETVAHFHQIMVIAGVALAAILLAIVAAVLLAARRRRHRRVATLFAVAIDEPQVSTDLLVQPVQVASGRPFRTIVVTGCDSAHHGLAIDLLASLAAAGREGLTLGFVHMGEGAVPDAITAMVDRMAAVPDDRFLDERLRGYRVAYLMIKARLPEFFPGFDVYVWLDGDTWVQNRLGVDQIIHSAKLADFCAHPELDPNYFNERAPSKRLIDLYGALYGEDAAARHVRLPMFNSGVLSATAGSPLWAAWREALTDVRRPMSETPGLYFSDQVPLHRLIATGRVSVLPLRAVNNWLTHAATPSVDRVGKRLVAPTYPHEEINILHLSGRIKDRKYRLAPDDREVSLRYQSIQSLFAE